MKAAEELEFHPNVLARSVATGRSAMIALVANAFHNPYVGSVIDIFTAELQRRNLRPLVFNLSREEDWAEAVGLMLQYRIDGVLLASSTVERAFLDRLIRARIPSVIALGRYDGAGGMDSVFVDNEEGGRIAAAQLLRRGYRKPGFIGAPETVSTSRDRLRGFRDLLLREGVEVRAEFGPNYSHDAGFEAATRLIERHPDTDAVFCADDLLGVGALDALRYRFGRGVPDTGVVGFNDIPLASWPSYRLASFRTTPREIVLEAIDLLEGRIRGGAEAIVDHAVACRFVERESVRSLATE